MSSGNRLADAIAALSEQPTGLQMITGKTTTTTNVIAVGNGQTIRVTRWVSRPTAGNKPVVLLIQKGSIIGLGLD